MYPFRAFFTPNTFKTCHYKQIKFPSFGIFSNLYENICSEKVNTNQKRKTEKILFLVLFCICTVQLFIPQMFLEPPISHQIRLFLVFAFFSIPYDILCSKKMNTNENKNSKTIFLFLTFVSSFQYRTTIFAHKKCIQTKTKKRQNYCSLKSYVSVQGIFYPQII